MIWVPMVPYFILLSYILLYRKLNLFFFSFFFLISLLCVRILGPQNSSQDCWFLLLAVMASGLPWSDAFWILCSECTELTWLVSGSISESVVTVPWASGCFRLGLYYISLYILLPRPRYGFYKMFYLIHFKISFPFLCLFSWQFFACLLFHVNFGIVYLVSEKNY